MPPPLYAGVAGITSRAQSEALLANLPSGFPRRLSIGVLACTATLAGQPDPNNPARSPARADIAGIFPDDARAYNLLHFHTKKTAGGEGLADELGTALALAGGFCSGIQINVPWPSAAEVMKFEQRWHTEIVLQVGPGALAEVDWSIPQIVKRLRAYADVVTHVLLDASGGTAHTFEDFDLAGLCAAVRAAYPSLGIGVAGGFNAWNLPPTELLRDVSIDAESGHRNHKDEFVPGWAQFYIEQIHRLLLVESNGKPGER